MEPITEDHELALEMVRLLSNELKAVRRQYNELKAKSEDSRSTMSERFSVEQSAATDENEKLRQENTDLRLRLAAAIEGREGKLHLSNTSPYEEVCKKLEVSENEKQLAENEHADIVQALQERLAVVTKKYKKAKQWKQEHMNSVSQKQALLDETVAKKDAPASPELLFDASKFLESSEGDETPVCLDYASPHNQFSLPQKLEALCAPDGLLHIREDELLYSEGTKSRFVTLIPQFVFNAKPKQPQWAVHASWTKLSESPFQKHEVFCSRESGWYYQGTYEHVGNSVLTVEEIRQSFGGEYVDVVEKRTTMNNRMLPPFVAEMVHSMYAEGLLSVGCFGFRYVGFNKELDDALKVRANSQQGWDARKRKREERTDPEGPAKKTKKAS